MKAPTREQQEQLREQEQGVIAAEREWSELQAEVAAAQKAWEASLSEDRPLAWSFWP